MLSGFQNIFNTKILQQKIASFQKGITSLLTTLQNVVSPVTVTTGTTAPVVTTGTETSVLPIGFVFTKPLTL
ncbi:MAG: hypothetical protein WCG98_05875 [bacterium]